MAESEPKIDWSPLVPGGESFITHALAEHGRGLVLKKTGKNFLWGAVAFTLGCFAVVGAVFTASALLMFFSLVLFLSGLYFVWPSSVLFDRDGRHVVLPGHDVPFDEIAGLQLVCEQIGHPNDERYSYELNLVLKNGSRLNVVDHSGHGQLQDEAAQLAAVVGCPVWDGSQNKPTK